MLMTESSSIAGELRAIRSQISALAESVGRLADLLDRLSRDWTGGERFLAEAQMAEHLGTTLAALRTRRFRKQIPDSVWMRQGRKVLYSTEAYERWLESEWDERIDGLAPAVQRQQPVKRRMNSKMKPRRKPYPLLV
ncbi:hypothetical protein [Pseudomonas citronellolis]|uniref:hypothetical protein n=1 Tax=Pseudomonas citronellolis TaxID=53408 RepID=UPI0007185F21|nr:hypothetical protein [Pseudomonas citronellolis]KRV73404.1 hypothetical protein AO742_04060 [Pseudomonas citronellolis]KRW79302.1 hypothetical protein AO738_27970 [Pseudomonas citronellolis]